MVFAAVKPYPLSPEDKTVKELASWYKGLTESEKQGQLIANHTMFFYFIDKIRKDFPKTVVGLSMENLALLNKGDYIIWDSHYGYRPSRNPNAINYTYFSERPNEYRLVKQFLSIDKRFAAIVFQKL